MSGTARTFSRRIGALGEVFDFLDESLRGRVVGERSRFILQLALEELFTNMVKYNSGSSHRITVRVTADDEQIRVDIVDPDTDPFDPAQLPAVDTGRPIRERKQGGLGLHLTRSMADGLEYHYEGREMTVSVFKYLE